MANSATIARWRRSSSAANCGTWRPSDSRAPSRLSDVSEVSNASTAFLAGEEDRLVQAAHQRSIGQTYLRVGNLKEAKKHLKEAERLLNTNSKELRAAHGKVLDETRAVVE